ncbi:MAG: hypothetical protein CMJ18_10215 [Phycisphaeraceae bacterium]|nr:hypothetical protein [Phycisphaeraceae bacterium]
MTPSRQTQLSWRKTFRLAWHGIRARRLRSLLVMGGIILAVAFLAYIMSADALLRRIVEQGPAPLVSELERLGVLAELDDADAAIQTRWMIGLALLICLVGVLNAMLLSVTERFAEIGTMKCLGAHDGMIIRLFLLESLFQGLAGTGLGVVIGVGFAVIEASVRYGTIVLSLLPLESLLRSAGTCLLAGTILTVIAAVYPARRAARMQPVAALRHEV